MTGDIIYLVQLPYLNEGGVPVVVRIDQWDAQHLRDLGTHRFLPGGGVTVVTPIVSAVINHEWQVGCDAY